MKRVLFVVFASLLLGALLMQKIAEGSGYVLISLGNTSVAMSFWTAVGAVILLALFGYILLWFFGGGWRLLRGGVTRLGARGQRSAQQRMNQGLIDFIEGNWKQALKHLKRSAEKSSAPMINYLASARCAHELGDEAQALELLHAAEKISPDNKIAAILTQARMLLAAEKYEQCVANLERARKISPHHPMVLSLLFEVYGHLKDWSAAKDLLPTMVKQKILPATKLQQLEKRCYQQWWQQSAERLKKIAAEDGASELQKQWDEAPSQVRQDQTSLTIYLQQLIKISAEDRAESLLRKELKREWNEELVLLYGTLAGRDSKKQLLLAETWLKQRPGSAELLLTLGRLCLRNSEWQKAQSYLESSLKLKQNPVAAAELARLLAHLGEYRQASIYYAKSSVGQLPDLPQPNATPHFSEA